MSLTQATNALPDNDRIAQAGAASPADDVVLPSAVDERLPAGKLFTLGLQHVLVMYAGAVAVPLIIGRALKLPPEQVAALISADLFCCGLVTLIQSLGLGKYFGIRLPVMMGVTFASVSPMLAMANNPSLGITGIFGAVIGAGVISLLLAPFVSRILPAVPARRHRHRDRRDRHFADAGRRQLGRRRPPRHGEDPGPGLRRHRRSGEGRRRRAAGRPGTHDCQPGLCGAGQPRHRAVRAGGDPADGQVRPRLPRQYRGAARASWPAPCWPTCWARSASPRWRLPRPSRW